MAQEKTLPFSILRLTGGKNQHFSFLFQRSFKFEPKHHLSPSTCTIPLRHTRHLTHSTSESVVSASMLKTVDSSTKTRVNIVKERMIAQIPLFMYFFTQVVFEFLTTLHWCVELLIWGTKVNDCCLYDLCSLSLHNCAFLFFPRSELSMAPFLILLFVWYCFANPVTFNLHWG